MTKTYASSPRPVNSPWGRVQTAEELAPGIWTVSTAGHGGIILSAQRDADMPEYLKSAAKYAGPRCYEEDCEWALVALAYPEAFNTLRSWQKPGDKTHYEYALDTAKSWHPLAYTKHVAA